VSLRVIELSGVASVQDLGRPGHAHEGVPTSGAADSLSLCVANRIAGNADGAAGIELAMGRLRVESTRPTAVVCSSGGRSFEVVELGAGDSIDFSPDDGLCRAYLAVAGGVDTRLVLGSRSTLSGAGFGGHEGRPLQVGDVLAVSEPQGTQTILPSYGHAMVQFALRGRVLRVVTDGAEAGLPAGLLRVSPKSNRTGVRLERLGGGHPIETGPSRGVLHGTVQAPSSGELVVLGPDGPTTGGYATVGAVIAADLPAVGQLVPGQWVRLEAVERETALELLAHQRVTLDAMIAPIE